MPIDLYMHPVSGPCRAVIMTAKLLGIEVNNKFVDLLTGGQFQPDFVKLNPQHCVPTINDNGFCLWESRAVISYLVSQYARGSSLYPKEPEERAVVDRMLYFDIGTLYKAQSQVLYPVFRKGEPVDVEKLEEYKKVLTLLEQFLSKTSFVAGNKVTIADISILATITTMHAIDFNFDDFPVISSWMKKMKEEIPSYEEINETPVNKFKEYLLSKQKV